MRWGQTRDFSRCRNNFLPRFLGLLTLGSVLTDPHLYPLTCPEACRRSLSTISFSDSCPVSVFWDKFQQSARSLCFVISPSRKALSKRCLS